MLVLLVSQAAQDLAHLDGDFLIQRLEEVIGSGVSPFDRIASATREVEALLAGERVWALPRVGSFFQPFSNGVLPGKRIRKRFGLSKYQMLWITFGKGLIIGYALAFFLHR